MDREATEERQIIPPINRFRGARARNHACSAALIQRFAIVGRPGIVSSTIFAQQAMIKPEAARNGQRSLMRRHSPVRISRHSEATDLRLSPIDSLYFKVHGKIRPSQNKLGDLKKS